MELSPMQETLEGAMAQRKGQCPKRR